MITEIESYILDTIDQHVEQASDDELFAGGYLRGHLTLVVAMMEQQQLQDPLILKQQVEASLQDAIQRGELSPRDQTIVLNLWDSLYQQASTAIEQGAL